MHVHECLLTRHGVDTTLPALIRARGLTPTGKESRKYTEFTDRRGDEPAGVDATTGTPPRMRAETRASTGARAQIENNITAKNDKIFWQCWVEHEHAHTYTFLSKCIN